MHVVQDMNTDCWKLVNHNNNFVYIWGLFIIKVLCFNNDNTSMAMDVPDMFVLPDMIVHNLKSVRQYQRFILS